MSADAHWNTGPLQGQADQQPATASQDWGQAQSLQPHEPAISRADPFGMEAQLNPLIERMEDNDRRHGETLTSMQTQVAALAERAFGSDPVQPVTEPPAAISDIEHRLDDFADPAEAGRQPAAAPISGQAPTASGHGDLDHHFTDISQRLDASLSAGAPAREAGSADRPMDPSVPPVETAPAPRHRDETLDSVDSQLQGLAAQLGRAEQQFGRLESIEGHLLRLMEMMHDARAEVDEVAQQTAEKTVRLFASEHDTTQAAGRLEAIRTELNALNDRARQMDERTVDTLEAMNETLKTLASRVVIGDAPAEAGPHAGATPDPHPVAAAPDPFAIPDPFTDEAPTSPQPDAAAAVAAPASQERPLGVEIPDYQPAASGLVPYGQGSEGIPQSEAPEPEPAAAGSVPAPAQAGMLASDDDFIASARRAAQAAAAQAQPHQAAKKSFLDRFKKAPSPRQTVLASAGSEDKNSRPVLVFAAVFLLIVSAVLLYGRLKSKPAAPTPNVPQVTIPTPDRAAPPATRDRSSMHQLPPAREPGTTGPTDPGSERASSLITNTPAKVDRLVPERPESSAPATEGREASAVPVSAEPARATAHLATPLPGLSIQISDPAPTQRRRVARTTRPDAEKTAPAAKAATSIPLPPAAVGPLSLRTAAAKGNAAAQFEVATRFAEGKGVDVNYVAAARWYKRAAAQGLAPAQYRLGAFYERGRGVEQDAGRARVWYRRAAEQGNVKAMHNLAVMQTSRSGSSPDYATAGQWFERAANLGLSDSQFNLGVLYQNGLGVRKNLAEAYKWYTLAAAGGDAEARKRLDLLKLQLLPETLKQADAAAANWKAKPVTKAANSVGRPTGGWRSAKRIGNAVTARAQTLLNKLGYAAGTPDGKMGPKTQAAIRTFQKRSGLAVTGEVDDTLINRLESLAS